MRPFVIIAMFILIINPVLAPDKYNPDDSSNWDYNDPALYNQIDPDSAKFDWTKADYSKVKWENIDDPTTFEKIDLVEAYNAKPELMNNQLYSKEIHSRAQKDVSLLNDHPSLAQSFLQSHYPGTNVLKDNNGRVARVLTYGDDGTMQIQGVEGTNPTSFNINEVPDAIIHPNGCIESANIGNTCGSTIAQARDGSFLINGGTTTVTQTGTDAIIFSGKIIYSGTNIIAATSGLKLSGDSTSVTMTGTASVWNDGQHMQDLDGTITYTDGPELLGPDTSLTIYNEGVASHIFHVSDDTYYGDCDPTASCIKPDPLGLSIYPKSDIEVNLLDDSMTSIGIDDPSDCRLTIIRDNTELLVTPDGIFSKGDITQLPTMIEVMDGEHSTFVSSDGVCKCSICTQQGRISKVITKESVKQFIENNPKLNAQTSVVDMLKALGLPSDFQTRKMLYAKFLAGEGDKYVSSDKKKLADQNIQLLAALQQKNPIHNIPLVIENGHVSINYNLISYEPLTVDSNSQNSAPAPSATPKPSPPVQPESEGNSITAKELLQTIRSRGWHADSLYDNVKALGYKPNEETYSMLYKHYFNEKDYTGSASQMSDLVIALHNDKDGIPSNIKPKSQTSAITTRSLESSSSSVVVTTERSKILNSYYSAVNSKNMNNAKKLFPVVLDMADKYDVPSHIALGIAKAETGRFEYVESNKDAKGWFQVLDTTGKQMLGDRYSASNMHMNTEAGIKYFKAQLDKYGTYEAAAAAYNAGPGRVDKWIQEGWNKKDIEAIPFKETRSYIRNVLGFSEKFRQTLS